MATALSQKLSCLIQGVQSSTVTVIQVVGDEVFRHFNEAQLARTSMMAADHDLERFGRDVISIHTLGSDHKSCAGAGGCGQCDPAAEFCLTWAEVPAVGSSRNSVTKWRA